MQNNVIDSENTTPYPAQSAVSTGKKVAAFILFGLAVLCGGVFFASSGVSLSILFDAEKAKSFGDALGAVFMIIFSVPAVIISAIPALLFNILSAVSFRKIERRDGSKLFKAFFIVSLVLLCLVIVVGALDAALLLSKKGS